MLPLASYVAAVPDNWAAGGEGAVVATGFGADGAGTDAADATAGVAGTWPPDGVRTIGAGDAVEGGGTYPDDAGADIGAPADAGITTGGGAPVGAGMATCVPGGDAESVLWLHPLSRSRPAPTVTEVSKP